MAETIRQLLSEAQMRLLAEHGEERSAAVGDVLRWRAFLRDLYTHRRKNLRGALSGWPRGRRPTSGG